MAGYPGNYNSNGNNNAGYPGNYTQPMPALYPSAPTQLPSAPPMMAQVQWQAPPQQYAGNTIATMRGRKKALLVGINYFGTRSELRGCINDVHNIKQFLMTRFGFADTRDTMLVLTDDQSDPHFRPTRYNMIQAMQWLVRGATQGDSLVFHYSGHGGQTQDLDGDESDGVDETILPVDFEQAGQIIDDELNQILVRQLQPGVRLTAIMDCCHSGSSLDLPLTYLPDGTIKETNAIKALGGSAMDAAQSALRGNPLGAVKSLVSSVSGSITRITKPKKTLEEKMNTKGNYYADAIMFSGCKDRQTSADARIGGVASGAMSYALIAAYTQCPNCSIGLLLYNTRAILRDKYSQVPQLSASRYLDMTRLFTL